MRSGAERSGLRGGLWGGAGMYSEGLVHACACFPLILYRRWYRTKKPYYVDYSFGFEPWVIAARARMPLYDVRYRGYGGNKQQHAQHLESLGFK